MSARYKVVVGALVMTGTLCWNVHAVSAQGFLEIGGGVGAAGRSSEDSLWSDTTAGWSAYVAGWAAERILLGARFVRTKFPDQRSVLTYSPRAGFPSVVEREFSDQTRTFVTAEVLYHFRRGRALRPLVGASVGWFRETFFYTCRPAGCEGLLSGSLVPGQRRTSGHGDFAIVAGVAGQIKARWRLRGSVRLHNLPGDHLGTSEVSVEVGYRF